MYKHKDLQPLLIGLKELHLNINIDEYSRDAIILLVAYKTITIAVDCYLEDMLPLSPEIIADDALFGKYIAAVEDSNPELKDIYTVGFSIGRILSLFNKSSKLLIYQYSISLNFNQSDLYNKILDIMHDGHFANEVDEIISHFLTGGNILTLGVRINQFASQINNFNTLLVLANDIGRWRENYFSATLIGKKFNLVRLGDLKPDIADDGFFEYIYLSANSNKYQQAYDYKISETLRPDSQINGQDYKIFDTVNPKTLSKNTRKNILKVPLGKSTLTFYHILMALKKLRPDGKLFISIHLSDLEIHGSRFVREYLVKNDLIDSIVYINTKRTSPRILLLLTNHKPPQLRNMIYYINSKFPKNDSIENSALNVEGIIECLQTKKIVADYCGTVSGELIANINYRLNPDVFKQLSTSLQDSKYRIVDFAQVIRGTSTVQDAGENLAKLPQFRLITPPAIDENGQIIVDKLKIVTSSEDVNPSLFELEAGDIIILARMTTLKVAFITPEILIGDKLMINNNLYCIRVQQPKLVNNYYLYRLLKSQFGQDLILQHATGGAMKSLSINQLKEISLALPNISQQEEIAELYFAAETRYHSELMRYNCTIAQLENKLHTS